MFANAMQSARATNTIATAFESGSCCKHLLHDSHLKHGIRMENFKNISKFVQMYRSHVWLCNRNLFSYHEINDWLCLDRLQVTKAGNHKKVSALHIYDGSGWIFFLINMIRCLNDFCYNVWIEIEISPEKGRRFSLKWRSVCVQMCHSKLN